jgi:uncharacterized protein
MSTHVLFGHLKQRAVQLPQAALIAVVRGYRLLLSPWLGSACRFTPTCSAYALDALTQHSAAAGSYLTLARLVRCHPWCDGGHDPVPAQLSCPKIFSRLLEKSPAANTCVADSAVHPTSVSKTSL